MISLHSLMPLAVLWSLFIFHIKHQRNAELVWRDAACPYSKLWGPSIICLQYVAPRQGFYTENAVLLVLSTTSVLYHQCQLWFPIPTILSSEISDQILWSAMETILIHSEQTHSLGCLWKMSTFSVIVSLELFFLLPLPLVTKSIKVSAKFRGNIHNSSRSHLLLVESSWLNACQ